MNILNLFSRHKDEIESPVDIDIPVDFDEKWYLEFNPDVAEAVKNGSIKSGKEHWLCNGKNESRLYAKPKTTVNNFSNIVLRIETTNACNFKCSFCPHGGA